MLFQPERHLPITDRIWDATVAVATICEVLTHCQSSFSKDTFWPMPEDEFESQVSTSIYSGAMGTLWALDYLQQYIDFRLPVTKSELADSIYEKYFHSEARHFSKFSNPDQSLPSYWIGETGILLVKTKFQPEKAMEIWEKQYSLIESNRENPTLEPLWGGTGSIIPALFKLEAEQSEKWANLVIDHCQFMRSAITRADSVSCPIWIQDLYGKKRMLLGAGHGFVGNMYPFVRGRRYLPDSLSDWVLETAVETTLKTASIHDEFCNWQSAIENANDGERRFLVQWCHGAPGVIISLNNIPVGYSQEFDQLLIKAGELIWKAGPLTKGVGLCHGTDGNGFALLKLYTRTGDKKWLNRARAFAMHAIGQKSGRHSLWEGDPGLACFLHACIVGDDNFPLLDVY